MKTRILILDEATASVDTEAEEQILAAGLVEEDWSMTLLFERVIPALKEDGMTDEQLETMLVANPARWLSDQGSA